MLTPAQQYLTLRSLGAPAVLLSLAMQGVFRGFMACLDVKKMRGSRVEGRRVI